MPDTTHFKTFEESMGLKQRYLFSISFLVREQEQEPLGLFNQLKYKKWLIVGHVIKHDICVLRNSQSV